MGINKKRDNEFELTEKDRLDYWEWVKIKNMEPIQVFITDTMFLQIKRDPKIPKNLDYLEKFPQHEELMAGIQNFFLTNNKQKKRFKMIGVNNE
jgi:hypothetical protein